MTNKERAVDLVEHLNMAFVLGNDKSVMYEIIENHFDKALNAVARETFGRTKERCAETIKEYGQFICCNEDKCPRVVKIVKEIKALPFSEKDKRDAVGS